MSASKRVELVVNDDNQLIDLALAGDSTAFEQLVKKYQDRLYNTLVHVVGSAEDARDVLQDTFVRAFIKLETFQRTAAFYSWLYRIALNMAISGHRRKRPVLSIDVARESGGEEPQDDGPAPEDRLERQERACQVQAALATLSQEFRAVMVLRDMEGYRYDEIAEMLALPVGTVRSRLFRARMLLREQLKEVLQEDRT